MKYHNTDVCTILSYCKVFFLSGDLHWTWITASAVHFHFVFKKCLNFDGWFLMFTFFFFFFSACCFYICGVSDGRVRLATLELSCLLLKQSVLSGTRCIIKDVHLACLEVRIHPKHSNRKCLLGNTRPWCTQFLNKSQCSCVAQSDCTELRTQLENESPRLV